MSRCIAPRVRRTRGSKRRAGASRGIRIDAELKGQVAGQARGRVEAAAERRRAAAELDLPMARGKVLFPDAQIEYVTAAGSWAALQRRGRVGALRRRGHPRKGGGGIPDVRGLGPRRVVRAAGARRRGQWRGPRPASGWSRWQSGV